LKKTLDAFYVYVCLLVLVIVFVPHQLLLSTMQWLLVVYHEFLPAATN